MITLPIYFALLLAGSMAIVITALVQPRRGHAVASGATALILLTWLLAYLNLPLAFTLPTTSILDTAPVLSWHVGAEIWSLSLVLLLLALGAQLLSLANERRGHPLNPAVIVYHLAFAALMALWAASLAAAVVSWTIVGLAWLAVHLLQSESAQARQTLLRRFGAAATALFLLWLAAAALPAGDGVPDIAAWPPLSKSLALLAAAVQIGLYTLFAWQMRARSPALPVAALVYVSPPLVGALLLARLEIAADVGLGFALPLTLAGLLGFLAAARCAWSPPEEGAYRLPAALLLGQGSLVLLAGVWADQQAVLAETRVLLLAGGIFYLAERRDWTVNVWQAGPALAAAAVAGLPLTAGFVGRSALYGAWIDQGRWILLLVTMLLHVALVAAMLRALADRQAGSTPQDAADPWRRLLPPLALLLPALFLLSAGNLREAPLLAWPAIFLPVAGALALTHFIHDAPALGSALGEALAIHFSIRRPLRGAQRLASKVGGAVKEAAMILEGAGGLVWILVFLVILWLVG